MTHVVGDAIRLAVISTAVPPGPAGQAQVLRHLLGWPCPENCLLLTDQPHFSPELAGRGDYARHRILGQLPICLRQGGVLRRHAPVLNEVAGLAVSALTRAVEIGRHVRDFDPHVLLACTASPFDLPASMMVALRQRRPLVAYLFDDPVYQWVPGPMRHLARLFEPMWSRVACELIAPNEAMAAEFLRRRGKRPLVIRNPVAPQAFCASPRPWPIRPGRYRIVYTGSVYHAQADAFVNLVRALEGAPGWELHVYTSQTPAQVAAHGIEGAQIFVHPHVTQEESYEIQRTADVLFLPLAFSSQIQDVLKTSAPMKMGEYLASGRPVLVHAPADTFVARHLRDARAGFVIDRPDPEWLARSLQEIATQPQRRCAAVESASRLARGYGVDHARATFWSALRRAARSSGMS